MKDERWMIKDERLTMNDEREEEEEKKKMDEEWSTLSHPKTPPSSEKILSTSNPKRHKFKTF